jgi:hypothetical protein
VPPNNGTQPTPQSGAADAIDTPKLKSLPEVGQYLRSGITFNQLDHLAMAMTDSQAADQLNRERKALFARIFRSTAA